MTPNSIFCIRLPKLEHTIRRLVCRKELASHWGDIGKILGGLNLFINVTLSDFKTYESLLKDTFGFLITSL